MLLYYADRIRRINLGHSYFFKAFSFSYSPCTWVEIIHRISLCAGRYGDWHGNCKYIRMDRTLGGLWNSPVMYILSYRAKGTV